MIKRNPLITAILLTASVCAACGARSQAPETSVNAAGNRNPLVTITMADGKVICAELYPDVAPNTVNNFLSLIKKEYYDGVIFHRVIPRFMIQGGDPKGTGQGGPGYGIFGEFTNNGFTNTLKHTRGVLSMARRGSVKDPASMYNTAGSQFFIIVADSAHLDDDYAPFGKVLSGLDVVDEIVSVDTDRYDKPLKDQKIKTMRADTFGVEYPEPQVIPE